MRFVDLSAPIVADPPELLRTEIDFAGHVRSARDIEAMFGVSPELLRDGEGWAVETFLRYIGIGPGVTPAATRWLHERGVRVMGIDAWDGTARWGCRPSTPSAPARRASSGPTPRVRGALDGSAADEAAPRSTLRGAVYPRPALSPTISLTSSCLRTTR